MSTGIILGLQITEHKPLAPAVAASVAPIPTTDSWPSGHHRAPKGSVMWSRFSEPFTCPTTSPSKTTSRVGSHVPLQRAVGGVRVTQVAPARRRERALAGRFLLSVASVMVFSIAKDLGNGRGRKENGNSEGSGLKVQCSGFRIHGLVAHQPPTAFRQLFDHGCHGLTGPDLLAHEQSVPGRQTVLVLLQRRRPFASSDPARAWRRWQGNKGSGTSWHPSGGPAVAEPAPRTSGPSGLQTGRTFALGDALHPLLGQQDDGQLLLASREVVVW